MIATMKRREFIRLRRGGGVAARGAGAVFNASSEADIHAALQIGDLTRVR